MTNIFKRHRGLTLIELIISIGVSTLLGATVVFMFQSTMDAYIFSEKHALIQKILDETVEEISGDSFRAYGIKDALQVLEARQDSFSFSCLWVDSSPQKGCLKNSFVLPCAYKLGSPLPILEFRTKGQSEYHPAPAAFVPEEKSPSGKTDAMVVLEKPLPAGAEARLIFEPEEKESAGVVMNISWDNKQRKFTRTYMKKTEIIPKDNYKEIALSEASFQYFDNTNTEISSPVPQEMLSMISAVKVTITLSAEGKNDHQQAAAFINLRNARGAGKGITLRPQTRIKIPDSKNIRTFSVGNIVGVQDDDEIQLKAEPQTGSAWKLTLKMAVKDNIPLIEGYTVEYPPGSIVHFEKVNQTLDIPFNLLNIGKNGRYDYDFDDDVENVVELNGDVWVSVDKMSVDGAALFVRP